MNATACVDASIIVAMLLPERYTASATDLWESWIAEDVNVVAPTLLGYEVTSAIYRNVLQGKIASRDGQKALQQFLTLDIRALYLPELHRAASALAKQFKRPNTYDAHYLALADHLACPLWTADERLYNTVRENFALIRWVEEKEKA